MAEKELTALEIQNFAVWLKEKECVAATIGKYLRDIREFTAWLEGRPISREEAVAWRERLLENGLKPVTVNSKLAALNGLFRFLGWEDCRVKFLRVQRMVFREQSKELTRWEYDRLLETAQALGRNRLVLLLETICGTGIRVSELRYITVEAVRRGRADIRLKGKVRTILLPKKLCRKLEKYAKGQKNTSGEIFLTKSGKSLSRKQIWREMKMLCRKAGVESSKVFPHNLRHLFASAFYRACRDIVKLADVLGHSSIETTRIYLLTAGAEHAKYLNRLGLVR